MPVFIISKMFCAYLIIKRANESSQELNAHKVQNTEKFIAFSLGHFQFKESCSFLSASLDKLVNL